MDKVKVDLPCVKCGERQAIEVDIDGYNRWRNGALIQNALPTLTADQREVLISGICSKCWNKMFGGDE